MTEAAFTTLVDAETLAGHLGDPTWIVVDCRFTLSDPTAGAQHFQTSRIPGARYADLERDLSGRVAANRSGGRHPLPDINVLGERQGQWGMTPEHQVVVYDDAFGSIAARLWWLLRWLGHQRVALLDGGWPRWKRLGLAIETTPPVTPAAGAPYPVAPNPQHLASAEEVAQVADSGQWRVLDARPEDRYTGEHDPIDPVAGHIPGSHFCTFEDALAFDGRLLPAAEQNERFCKILAGVPPTQVIHTCGSGVTACLNVLAMEHAGLPGSKLYAGSWSDWISQPSRPIETGPGPGMDL